MLGKGQLSEYYSTECFRGSDYESERCILFEVRDICFLELEYVQQRLVIFGMFLVNTKRQKESLCVRNWSSVGRGSYFNAHNIQAIGFQPTSYPKETCASQLQQTGLLSKMFAWYVYNLPPRDLIHIVCLLLIDKARARDKTYI